MSEKNISKIPFIGFNIEGEQEKVVHKNASFLKYF